MYLELFKLNELPFRLSPDPSFLYLSKHHARAKAYMESTIWFTDGFVVITGEIGSGKTTLIETFLRELEKDVVVAQINQTQLSATEFLQAVLVQFGFSPFKMKKAEVLSTLNNFLIEQYANNRKVLLIIDEAQNLTSQGARGGPPAVWRRNHQGEGVADHPGGPAGAQRQAELAGTRCSSRSVFGCDFISRPCRKSTRVRTFSTAWRFPARRDARSSAMNAGVDLPTHRRNPATHQYGVRYLDDGRLRAG